MRTIARMIAGANTWLVVDVPSKDRRMGAKTGDAVAHQLIPLLPVGRVIDAGALPTVVILIHWICLTLPINNFCVGIPIEKLVIDIKGGEAKEHVDGKLMADIEQAGHFIQLAIKANPNA